jgi:hypothetical protein
MLPIALVFAALLVTRTVDSTSVRKPPHLPIDGSQLALLEKPRTLHKYLLTEKAIEEIRANFNNTLSRHFFLLFYWFENRHHNYLLLAYAPIIGPEARKATSFFHFLKFGAGDTTAPIPQIKSKKKRNYLSA